MLGDYGTGKTSLARKLAHDLGKKHLEDPTQSVPVLINLREATACLTLDNFRQLNRAVRGKSKVLLTCRTHYFRDIEEEKKHLGGDHLPGLSYASTELYREIAGRSEFKIVYLQELTENQVKEYFNKVFGATGLENYRIMKGVYHLEMLSKRPVLLDMIVKSLNRIGANDRPLRPAELYSVSTIEYESGLIKDLPRLMERLIPQKDRYFHNETWHDGNGHSHLKATLIGPSLTIPFQDKQLILGTWQQVVFLEFDNKPHHRRIAVQLMGE